VVADGDLAVCCVATGYLPCKRCVTFHQRRGRNFCRLCLNPNDFDLPPRRHGSQIWHVPTLSALLTTLDFSGRPYVGASRNTSARADEKLA
jgi:hypothetical protein